MIVFLVVKKNTSRKYQLFHFQSGKYDYETKGSELFIDILHKENRQMYYVKK